jgi:hypothetical protein
MRATGVLQVSSGPSTLHVSLGTVTTPDANHCPALDATARAFLDNQPLTMIEPGGPVTVQPPGITSSYTVCQAPTFELKASAGTTLTDEAVATIQLVDSTDSWSVQVEHPFAARSFAVVSPSSGTLHAGDAVTVTWSSSTDTINGGGFAQVMGFVPTQPTVQNAANTFATNVLQVSGQTVSFVVPAESTWTQNFAPPASGSLILYHPLVSMKIDGCTGPDHCAADLGDDAIHASTPSVLMP